MTVRKQGRPAIYPFGVMKVGDERHIEGDILTISPAACMFAKRRGGGMKFMCKTQGSAVRIWRIA